MATEHHNNDHHYRSEYLFCPRCGGSLSRKRIKDNEPERRVCSTCTFIIVYLVKVVGGPLKAMDETLEAATFAPDEIPWGELAFDSTRVALREYLALSHGAQCPPNGRQRAEWISSEVLSENRGIW